jgi:hypothetical protein
MMMYIAPEAGKMTSAQVNVLRCVYKTTPGLCLSQATLRHTASFASLFPAMRAFALQAVLFFATRPLRPSNPIHNRIFFSVHFHD